MGSSFSKILVRGVQPIFKHKNRVETSTVSTYIFSILRQVHPDEFIEGNPSPVALDFIPLFVV